LVVAGGLLTYLAWAPASSSDAAAALPSEPIVVEPVPPAELPVLTTIVRGDTIESVTRRLAGDDWVAWRDALVEVLDPRKLAPGIELEGRCSPSGALQTLQVRLDQRRELRLERSQGQITIETLERAVVSELKRVVGTVTSSLFGAMQDAGEHPSLAVRFAEIFQWDIDFFRDLRTGDRFVAIVDRQSIDGTFYGYGQIYAARFVNRGTSLTAILFPGPDGMPGYYDLDGAPLRKQFLRSPLKLSRITSHFNLNRFHPILKRRRPHYGVDYGAPVGTPVHVTASGTVTLAGRNGGAGKMVRVRHSNGYETNYLHLSRFASGIRRGARVTQGQVIGYVGSTGLSTGPHLDYRIRQNGSWINPLRLSSPPVEPLPEASRHRFLAHSLGVLELLEGREPPTGMQS
jgi:murein DD-endopeptidase MepM/ murein hydrolase activator NlpD